MNYQNSAYGHRLIYGLGFGPYDWGNSNPGLITLKGKVIDFSTNNPISAAHVYYIKNEEEVGVITNQNGEYELEASPTDTIIISFLGYDGIVAQASEILETEYLIPKPEELDEIIVTAKKKKDNMLMGLGVLGAVILGLSIAKNQDKTE